MQPVVTVPWSRDRAQLAPSREKRRTTIFDGWMAVIHHPVRRRRRRVTRGLLQKLLILAGLVAAYLVYLALANGMGSASDRVRGIGKRRGSGCQRRRPVFSPRRCC